MTSLSALKGIGEYFSAILAQHSKNSTKFIKNILSILISSIYIIILKLKHYYKSFSTNIPFY